jgi:hypothetical protein
MDLHALHDRLDQSLDTFARNNQQYIRSLRGYEYEESDDPCGRRKMTVQELDDELDEYYADRPSSLPGRKDTNSFVEKLVVSVQLMWARWKFGL